MSPATLTAADHETYTAVHKIVYISHDVFRYVAITGVNRRICSSV